MMDIGIDLSIPAARRGRRIASVVAGASLIVLSYPLLAGLLTTFRTAFFTTPDHTHAITRPTLDTLRAFMAQPGVVEATLLSLWTGLLSTGLALLMSAYTLQVWFAAEEQMTTPPFGRPSRQRSIAALAWFPGWSRLLMPLIRGVSTLMLAFPHVAFAIGLALLIAPSGTLLRWLSPWLTGFERPPLWTTVQDPWGISLIVGLALKESAFFTLTFLALAQQSTLTTQRTASRALGYSFASYWWKVALPQLYRQARFPVLIVLSFSVAVVEIALLLGPTTPPTLGVLIWSLLTDAELQHQRIAAAGALVLTATVLLAFLCWWVGEWLIARSSQAWRLNGQRRLRGLGSNTAALMSTLALLTIVGLSLLSVLLFAASWRWTFRTPLPEQWQVHLIGETLAQLRTPILNSLLFAISCAGLSVIMVIGLLELLYRARRPWLDRLTAALMLIPLLLPPLVFLVGVQLALLRWRWDGTLVAVLMGHVIYALPYAYLVLRTPWRDHDPMMLLQARLLTRSAWQALWRVKIPQLWPSISYALALTAAVSIAQYLTTLLLGAGRWPTLTTEAVALGSGGDRRLMAILAVLQCAIPLLGFALAQLAGRRATQHPSTTL